jgi:hypothetical protein
VPPVLVLPNVAKRPAGFGFASLDVDVMAPSIRQVQIWILEALKAEQEREPNLMMRRTTAVTFGEVMEQYSLKNTDIDLGFRFLTKQNLVKSAQRPDHSWVAWISDDGLQYLDDYYLAVKTERAQQEREEALAKVKQEREVEHTLWCYWCLADWRERVGMITFLFAVFLVGYLSASNHLVSRIISLIRDVMP